MTIAQLLVWTNVIPSLISAGIMAENQIAALLKSFHKTMTDAELNAVTALIITHATAHLAQAQADAGVK